MGGSGGVRLVVVWLVVLCLFGGCLGYFAKWDIEYMFWSPDCVENIVMGINGEFPGPTIRAKAGETIHISLTNKLHTEGVVIHWHGIRQHGTPWADGTASISQCTINPGEPFPYRFTVDKAGTYFYHGHYGMQRSAGLYGLLIVDVAEGETEPFHYDDELNILLSDWWHQSSQHQEVRLSSNPMRWIGEPQTLLINGRGQYDCSIAPEYSKTPISKCQLKGGEHCAPPILKVLPNKAYRLRIASTTALASLHFAIAGHKMVVVEADGNYVQPFETDDLYIYSGESYSVLITTNQKPENYWISVSQIARKSDTSRALTVLNYQDIDISKSPTLPPFNAPTWDDFESFKKFSDQILAHMNTRKPPNKYDTQILLVNTQNKINGYTKWFISNVSLVLPTTPYLGSLKYDLTDPNEKSKMEQPPQSPTLGAGLYMLDYKSTVDVILQNAHMAEEGASEIHPWHLHGHDFWVLGYGNGKFEKGDEKNFNLINPPYRNTAVLFPHGWTALRFVADNPGVWAFHCHIEPHLHMGMGVVFAEGVEQVDGNGIPNKALACGLFAEKFMHLNKH